MKIGIDARLYGPKDTGIGRYVENLIINLLKLDKTNSYVLFVRKDNPLLNSKCQISNVKYVIAEARHYSLKEQFLMPFLVLKEKLDLMHYPHFNVPIFFPGKFVVTTHDLIKHTSKGLETTTRTPYFYWLKYLGYKLVFWLAVKRAKLIFVPSKTVTLQLTKVYKIPGSKIKVTYEGVENKLKIKNEKLKILERYNVRKPYLLYVGNVYPHKNVNNLIKAIKIVNELRITDYEFVSLVIVCARNVFWERLEKEIKNLRALNFVNLVGFVQDEELAVFYNQAEAFVFPSESEGFGLPGLEAMACGLPVLASDIPVFKEVYQDAALYFDPKNPKDIAIKIKNYLSDRNLQKKLKTKGPELAEGYSWQKMAKETLNGYKTV